MRAELTRTDTNVSEISNPAWVSRRVELVMRKKEVFSSDVGVVAAGLAVLAGLYALAYHKHTRGDQHQYLHDKNTSHPVQEGSVHSFSINVI